MKTQNKRFLFQSNINHLGKVCNHLAYSQKMNGTQVILGGYNEAALHEAEELIYRAMRLLRSID